MRKTTVWPLCSIFSNDGHVFQRIKNPHISSMHDTPRNIHTKFGSNWSSSFRGEEFWKIVNDEDGWWRMAKDIQLSTLYSNLATYNYCLKKTHNIQFSITTKLHSTFHFSLNPSYNRQTTALSTFHCNPASIDIQLSTIHYNLFSTDIQISTFHHNQAILDIQLSTIHYSLATIDIQLSTLYYSLAIIYV